MTGDVNKILSERGGTHGDFSDNAATTQEIKELMFNCVGWTRLSHVQREALDMIAHKIGRILAGDPNFKDHWDDIAGYATLVANRCKLAEKPLTREEQQELARIKDAANSVKLHCTICGLCMRVNAAGYAMCEFKDCPNAGKKVL